MKRILQITPGLYVNGASLIARNIGLLRDPEKYEVEYLVFSDEVDIYEKQLTEAGCKVFHAPVSSGSLKGYLQIFAELKKLMRERRYDAVHAHTMFQCGIVMLAAKQCGVPIRIAHAHNSGKTRNSLLSIPYEIVMRWLILLCATELVACGQSAGEFLFGKRVFRDRGRLILNQIDTERYLFDPECRDRVRKELGLENRFVIGNIGRLAACKNQMFLLNLMPTILEKKKNAVLLIVGEGSERQSLTDRIEELKLQDRAILTGNLDGVQQVLNAMDVFVLPSLFEGIALVQLEALSNGLPCIISEHSPVAVNMPNQITIIPLADKKAWADAICTADRKNTLRTAADFKCLLGDTDKMMQEIFSCYEA